MWFKVQEAYFCPLGKNKQVARLYKRSDNAGNYGEE
jgi:hypothetical protein